MDHKKRVLIILYAGDYYAAYQRMINGSGELYHHHNYALKSISDFSRMDGIEEIAVLGCATQTTYNHFLDSGFRVIGAGIDPYKFPGKINRILEDFKPTHIVLRFPIASILKWSLKNNVKLITLLADSFSSNNLRSLLFNCRLARLLNHPGVEWVGNHHINSCISLKNIGVIPDKIIPWDWPRERESPLDFEPKKLDQTSDFYTFLYVGTIAESKGVGDLITAMSLLKRRGFKSRLKIAGKTDKCQHFKEQAISLDVNDYIDFLGFVPNDKVVHLMRDCDAVFVPSWHAYPEGLPSTIYEALCSRTPVITSDHPMFLNNVKANYSALIFPERRPDAIVECVERLFNDPELYFQLSSNSYEAWKSLQLPVSWANLIKNWLYQSPDSQQWIYEQRLTSGLYDQRLKGVA